jgi:selenocysteine lyase/cysteine desulfurase
MDIRDISALFDIPEGVTFLNCANMSPQLHSVTAAGLDAVRKKAEPWKLSSDDWFAAAEELRRLAALLLETDVDNVALVPAVSYGLAVAARNVRVSQGQAIVILEDEFPSNVYTWRELAAKKEACIRTVKRPLGEGWTEALLQAITENTAVVSVPQYHWMDGSWINLVRVGERARQVGAALVIDASQSLGVSPLNLDEVQPDFLVSVGYKWLLGPYGLGYLYVDPKWHQEGSPLEQSWLARSGSEDFTRLIEYRDDYRKGARRFDMGEFPQFVLAPMAIAALSQILKWEVKSISDSLSDLTKDMALRAGSVGYLVLPFEQRCSHMLGIRLPGGVPPGLPGALAAASVHVSIRGDVVRVAPHLYNDTGDVERLFAALASEMHT